jgi:hypothetical protein
MARGCDAAAWHAQRLDGTMVHLGRRAPHTEMPCTAAAEVRVWVEIMGSPTCGIVGKSQPVLLMVDPMIFTRTRHD